MMEETSGNPTDERSCPDRIDKSTTKHSSVSINPELIQSHLKNGKTNLPPDGGYGYVIIFAAFISSAVVDGVTFSFGILKDSIIANNIGVPPTVDQATVAWVGSLLAGLCLFNSPLVSTLTHKFGLRIVAVVGGVITSSSFISCWYINRSQLSITALIVLYGIMGGIGFSCIYVPSVLAVGLYFKKKRVLVTTIAACGSGFGSFIFPSIIEFMIDKFQWHGAILGLAVIGKVCAFVGVLYKPLQPKVVNDSEVAAGSDEEPVKAGEFKRFDVVKHDTDDEYRLDFEAGQKKHFQQYTENLVHNFSSSTISISRPTEVQTAQEKPQGTGPSTTKTWSIILDFYLWKSVTFFTFSNACLFLLLGMPVPFIYLTNQARYTLKGRNMVPDPHAITWLISIIGLANIIGRMISCWIVDRPCVNILAFHNKAVLTMGMSTLFLPFLRHYYQLVMYSCVYGLSMGCCVTFKSILVVGLFGLDKLMDSYGYILLVEGVASAISLPLAATVVEKSGDDGSFAMAFFFAGGCITIAACLFFQIDRIQRWQQKRERKQRSCSNH